MCYELIVVGTDQCYCSQDPIPSQVEGWTDPKPAEVWDNGGR